MENYLRRPGKTSVVRLTHPRGPLLFFSAQRNYILNRLNVQIVTKLWTTDMLHLALPGTHCYSIPSSVEWRSFVLEVQLAFVRVPCRSPTKACFRRKGFHEALS